MPYIKPHLPLSEWMLIHNIDCLLAVGSIPQRAVHTCMHHKCYSNPYQYTTAGVDPAWPSHTFESVMNFITFWICNYSYTIILKTRHKNIILYFISIWGIMPYIPKLTCTIKFTWYTIPPCTLVGLFTHWSARPPLLIHAMKPL